MLNFIKRNKNIFIELAFYLAIFVFTFIAYIMIKPQYFVIRNGVVAQTFTVICIFITSFVFFMLKKYQKLDENKIILFMLLISYFIRLGYILYTPNSDNLRQYDTFINTMDGHEGYAWTIFTTGKLPSTNNYQFYHPPLNAFIQALFMNFSGSILEINQNQFNIYSNYLFQINDYHNVHILYETCQILSVMYTMIISITSYKILKALKIRGKGLLIAFAFLCFFPRFIQLSGQLNNDSICIMFCFLTIYYSIKWYKTHSYYHIIMLAISIGLAMMSKISGAIICITPAIIFVIEYIKVIKTKNIKDILNLSLKYILFLMICAPLGLWFQVYALNRFHQPLGYVYPYLNDQLSTAHHNFFERFILIINFDEIFSNIFPLPWDNYCIFNYILKSAIFGEFGYWQGECFAIITVILNYLFVFSSIALFIRYLIKTKGHYFLLKLVGLSIIATQTISMIYFNIKMPYGCTMDFRYIVPIVIGFGLLLGGSINYFEKHQKTKFTTIVSYITLGFLFFSNLFYLVCI